MKIKGCEKMTQNLRGAKKSAKYLRGAKKTADPEKNAPGGYPAQ